MEKCRAIPQGYMTIGELAGKMNSTVRTLQYYDKEGILKPSGESGGGRRLYTDKDVFKLHQIQSMKFLGFSLDDIKNRLALLDTPADVACAFMEQAEVIRGKIASLSDALEALEKLTAETLRMKIVDFKKYADIVLFLQAKNENYWVLKYFDGKLLEHLRNRFDEENGRAMLNKWKRLHEETEETWWELVNEFTGGDMELLPGLDQFVGQNNQDSEQWRETKALAHAFVQKSLEIHLQILAQIRSRRDDNA